MVLTAVVAVYHTTPSHCLKKGKNSDNTMDNADATSLVNWQTDSFCGFYVNNMAAANIDEADRITSITWTLPWVSPWPRPHSTWSWPASSPPSFRTLLMREHRLFFNLFCLLSWCMLFLVFCVVQAQWQCNDNKGYFYSFCGVRVGPLETLFKERDNTSKAGVWLGSLFISYVLIGSGVDHQ